jgi:hypothetical protein
MLLPTTLLVKRFEEKNIKVVVACCHSKRFNESLPNLLAWVQDSIQMLQKNIKFIIHIDEAHKYIPENIDMIRSFNDSQFVSEIIEYTATPDGIWSDNISDHLLHRIFICDVDKETENIKHSKYFGVESCEINSYDHLNEVDLVCRFVNIIDPDIPIPKIVKQYFKNIDNMCENWYYKNRPLEPSDKEIRATNLNFLHLFSFKTLI